MTIGHTVLVADGDMPPRPLLQKLCAEAKNVIALDGAANVLQRNTIVPNVILGDFDTLLKSHSDVEDLKSTFPHSEIIRKADQNTTDLEKGLAYCVQQKLSSVLCLGLFGQALDHTLYNASLFAQFSNQIELMFLNTYGEKDYQWGFILPEECCIRTNPNVLVSFIPLTPCVVDAQDLVWPLKQAELHPNQAFSIRNKTNTDQLSIKVKGQCLFLYTAKSSPHYSIS